MFILKENYIFTIYDNSRKKNILIHKLTDEKFVSEGSTKIHGQLRKSPPPPILEKWLSESEWQFRLGWAKQERVGLLGHFDSCQIMFTL